MNHEDIIGMAREAGVSIRGHYDETGSTPQELQRFYERAVAAEGEACAKICEDMFSDGALNIADAIRARGQHRAAKPDVGITITE